MNTRRRLLAVLSMTTILPRVGAAQKAAPFRVGWLSLDRSVDSIFIEAFRSGLRDLGYIEGKNLTIDARWGEGSRERLEQLAAELVSAKPHLIVTQGGTGLHPVRKTGTTVPIVFGYSGDPVEAGLVDSFARPGRNLTGMSFLALDLVGKRIEILKELIPKLARVAVLANPEHPGDQAERRASKAAADTLGVSIDYFATRNVSDLENSLAAIPKSRSEAVVVFPDALTVRNRERIAASGLKHRIPVVSGWDRFADSGCLITYGPNLRASYRRLATYAHRILRGAKPADLPVELPTVVEMVINLKTAKALGISIPQSMQVRADRVIE